MTVLIDGRIMNKVIILLSLLVFLTACSNGQKAPAANDAADNAVAVEVKKLPELNAEDIRVVVQDGGAVVDFHCEASEETNRITAVRVDTDVPQLLFRTDAEFNRVAEKPCDLIIQDDINDDGFMDVLTPMSLGLQNAYYYAWLWSEEAHTFIIIQNFDKLSNPTIDKEKKQIRAISHTSAAEHEASLWQMIGTALVPLRRIEVSPCEADEPCFLKKSIVYVNERPQETVTKIPRSEFNEQVFEL
ncbi:MAG: hypothetical protein J6A01_04845 [Proteobacteria bacterium]|nr:hypothetical protein [Pseudomonadota bacterium]